MTWQLWFQGAHMYSPLKANPKTKKIRRGWKGPFLHWNARVTAKLTPHRCIREVSHTGRAPGKNEWGSRHVNTPTSTSIFLFLAWGFFSAGRGANPHTNQPRHRTQNPLEYSYKNNSKEHEQVKKRNEQEVEGDAFLIQRDPLLPELSHTVYLNHQLMIKKHYTEMLIISLAKWPSTTHVLSWRPAINLDS